MKLYIADGRAQLPQYSSSSSEAPLRRATCRNMGHHRQANTPDDPKVKIQERGEIFFFYRPRGSPGDVQNLYIVLRPDSGEKKANHESPEKAGMADQPRAEGQEDHEKKRPLLRFIVLGRKSLPEASKKPRPHWGYVELVTTNREDLEGVLSAGEEAETAARGSRARPAARALAQGMYRILRHCPAEEGVHTHLVYKLEQPRGGEEEEEEEEEALNVKEEGSFIIQIKNPEKGTPASSGLQNKRKASFPARLQGQFGASRFVSADPPEFLNYEGCEFILVSAADDVDSQLGLQAKGADDVDAELGLDFKDGASCSSDLVAMKMFEETVPVEPLLDGTRA